MSGYLEVKYPFRSNLGLNPFKSWKRQWCILRPSPTFSGGILAVYCSEAGASAGTIELPAGLVVRRAKSRTRPHAFAVFHADEPRKPRVLLAATTLQDAQVWMEKIKCVINGNKMLETETLLKDSYSVTVDITEFSRRYGLSGADSTVTVSSTGVLVSRGQKLAVFVEWEHVTDATLTTDTDRNGTCIMTVDSGFHAGGGSLRFSSPLAGELTRALRRSLQQRDTSCLPAKLSKSEGDLRAANTQHMELGDVRRSSWYSGPSEVSLDDLDLVMSKESARIPCGQLSRCAGAPHLAPPAADNSMSDRCSLASVASGIYEEIPDEAPPPDDNVYCKMSRDTNLGLGKCLSELEGVVSPRLRLEPQYECVQECVSLYGTMRRARRLPPPLPPRSTSTQKSWWCVDGVTRHGSLGSLGGTPGGAAPGGTAPVGAAPAAHARARTLPRWDRSRQAFSAFRKRLKSDSRAAVSPKSDTTNSKHVETKKKKFDFTPTRDIFRTFRVSRKKDLKVASLGAETKSCEHIDAVSDRVAANRCSQSAECLDGEYSDLSIELEDVARSLPPELVRLILHGRDDISGRKAVPEGDYMPMSPIVPAPPPLDRRYIVMSPRSNIA